MQKVKRLTCIPNFDRPVIGTGDDLGTIWREGNGADVVAVGALLARLELQST